MPMGIAIVTYLGASTSSTRMQPIRVRYEDDSRINCLAEAPAMGPRVAFQATQWLQWLRSVAS
ncbi:hypothetical protein D9M68_279430 [compost metagenome]